MPIYHEAFTPSEFVKIADLETLKKFQEDQKQELVSWHHPLQDDMLSFAGKLGQITMVSHYHGGDVLYEFLDIPGIWHEQCLIDCVIGNSQHSGYELASTRFTITAEETDGLPVIVVRDLKNRKLLVAYRRDSEIEAKNMTEVSRVRSQSGFEHRYRINSFVEQPA